MINKEKINELVSNWIVGEILAEEKLVKTRFQKELALYLRDNPHIKSLYSGSRHTRAISDLGLFCKTINMHWGILPPELHVKWNENGEIKVSTKETDFYYLLEDGSLEPVVKDM